MSDKYDQNDLGFQEYNNDEYSYASVEYNIYKPFWKMLYSYNSLSYFRSNLYAPRSYSAEHFSLHTNSTFKNYLTLVADAEVSPWNSYDYYEPRVPGMYITRIPNWWINTYLSSDYRKKLALDVNVGYLKAKSDWGKDSFWWMLSPRLRLSNRILLVHEFSLDHEWHDYGFADMNGADVIIGKRDVRRVENIFSTHYIFSRDIALSLRLRHYWSTVKYYSYYNLQSDGSLQPSSYNTDNNTSFNVFNADIVFSWRFAPGSEADIVWKNSIISSDDKVNLNYYDDLHNTLVSPQLNSLSVKILYYLDYNKLRRK